MEKQTSERLPNEADVAVEEALAQVNKSVLHDMRTALRAHPAMDMTALLQLKLYTYPTLRKIAYDRAIKSAVSSVNTAVEETVPELPDARDYFHIPADSRIIMHFSTAVAQLAQVDSARGAENENPSAIIEGLNKAVASSEVLWHLGSKAVLGLSTQLVMKVGIDMEIGHIDDMECIRKQAPSIPMPEIHGIFQQQDGNRIFLFMSRIPGESLDLKWDFFDNAQKDSIQEQLEVIMRDLRSLRPPPSKKDNAVLGSGQPRRCKDARRKVRTSSEPISNEADFNEFITSNPRRPGTCHIAMIRSYLEVDHNFAMTHGDLHPRNIMVTVIQPHNTQKKRFSYFSTLCDRGKDATPTVSITGILGWEMCGLYPDYWEYVKALKNVLPGAGCDDWWTYLPCSIGIWPKEYAIDSMLSRWHG